MPETLLLKIPSLNLLSAKNFKVMVQIKLNKMTQNAEMEAVPMNSEKFNQQKEKKMTNLRL